MTDLRRQIPSMDRLLSSEPFAQLLREYPRPLIVTTLRAHIEQLRATLTGTGRGPRPQEPAKAAADEEVLAGEVRAGIEALGRGTLRPVLNATGVVLHTNLGRAPLAADAVRAIHEIASGYSNLEYDIAAGARGSRYGHCRQLLTALTGAEDALVVNNNAAALVLALNTLSRGLDAVISRGELVEIGGAFRVPEIMARSGALLREVGATNRTHLEDYRAAISPQTGVLLKVHPSNFTIDGYVADVSPRELALLGADAGVPLVHDIGSGLLLDPVQLGLPDDEPTPQRSLTDGAAVVTLSGDKLLGGPQCGILLGSAALMDRMRRNPLCRALRVDKLTLAALAATLRLYLDPARALRDVPILRMLALPLAALEQRAHAFAAGCDVPGLSVQVEAATSAVGGGASPAAVLPTALVVLTADALSATELERRLRTGQPAVIARIVGERVALDLRTITPADEGLLLVAIRSAAVP
ncbi:MAG: L-seryl-tRNA(Sec) selenium transferase [Gemmatimonadota bacterium]